MSQRKEGAPKKTSQAQASDAPLAKSEIDLARQTGDTDCYKIYLRSMGWKVIGVVFPIAMISTALEIMPREFSVTCFFAILTCQKSGYDCGRNTAKGQRTLTIRLATLALPWLQC